MNDNLEPIAEHDPAWAVGDVSPHGPRGPVQVTPLPFESLPPWARPAWIPL